MGIRVRSPQGDMFKLIGNWEGDTMGQDYAGRGRMLVWLSPADAMARVEPEEAPDPVEEAAAIIAHSPRRELPERI